MPINRESVQNKIRACGFRVFDGPHDYDVQLFGLRRRNRDGTAPPITGSRFDDLLGAMYRKGGVWQFHVWPGTTDPQGRALTRDDRPHAAVIASPQQIPGFWTIGTFAAGKPWEHEALVPVADCRTWRDKDRDGLVDFGGELYTSTPASGLSWHKPIGDSYGCQEFEHLRDFNESMAIAHSQVNAGLGKLFTYTLLDWPADDFVIAP